MEQHQVGDFLEVLAFWLQGDARLLYSSKWFSTGAQQQIIDAEISVRFSGLLERALEGELATNWVDQGGVKGRLALILVLDQFSRHIFRYKGLSSSDGLREWVDKLALMEALALIEEPHWDDTLNLPEFIFAIMPLRHSNDIELYKRVLQLVDVREKSLSDSGDLLQKFKKQTLRRYQHLGDRARAEEAEGDILEQHAFQAVEINMHLHPLVATTRSFLLKQDAFKHKNTFLLTSSSTDKQHQQQQNQSKQPVFISLSGGVDSMVICKILVHLRDTRALPIGDVVAVHVDYGNREESAAEAAFVEHWCGSLGVVCSVRRIVEVRRGVTSREEYERVARDIRYAAYREVMAAHLSPTAASAAGDSAVSEHGVIFGHHQGDLQENVISNVMRGCSPLQLAGMSEVSAAHGVVVWRPLLLHNKALIFDFAHQYGVPYFRDSTPSWSTRGKLRNQLIPLLTDMYGAGFLQNLSALAVASEDNRLLVEKNLYQPFLQSICRHPCGLAVNVLGFLGQPACFWAEVLRQMMHSMRMAMVRDKSVANFVDYIHRRHWSTGTGAGSDPADMNSTEQLTWLELRKGFYTYLTSSGDLVIYRDGVFVSTGQTNADEAKCPLVNIPTSHPHDTDTDTIIATLEVGCWRITVVSSSSLVPSDKEAEEAEYVLQGGGDASACILGGRFSYLVRPSPETRQLCLLSSGGAAHFICVGKGRKKSADERSLKVVFRGLDAKLRDGLPLLVEASNATVLATATTTSGGDTHQSHDEQRQQSNSDSSTAFFPVQLRISYEYIEDSLHPRY